MISICAQTLFQSTRSAGSVLTSALAREFNIHRIKEQERIAAAEPHNEQQQPTKKPIPEQTKAQLPAPPRAPHIESRARPQAQPAQQPTPAQRLKANHQQIPTHPPSRQTPQPPSTPTPRANQPNAPPQPRADAAGRRRRGSVPPNSAKRRYRKPCASKTQLAAGHRPQVGSSRSAMATSRPGSQSGAVSLR